nr:MAG TPA: hypothetical protein [Bacteriophage sp.]
MLKCVIVSFQNIKSAASAAFFMPETCLRR